MARRTFRSLFTTARIGHVRKGVNYAIGNSYRGLRWLKRLGRKKADRDLQMTRDRVTVVTHWPRPLEHGFIDPLHKIPHHAAVADHDWSEWKRCYVRVPGFGKFYMHTLDQDLALLARLGMEGVLEPKGDHRMRNQRYWDGVKKLADKHHARISGYTLKANAANVPFMRAAGIRAFVLSK